MDALIFWVALSIIVLAYMTLWYGIARYVGRVDVVDTAWGLGFILVAWVSLALRAHFDTVQIVSAGLVSLWGFRLSAHLARRSLRRGKDDHRYEELQQKWKGAEHKMYTNVFLLQGLLVMLVSLPMIAIAFSSHEANAWTYVGWAVWVFGIGFEALADYQLGVFLATRPKGSHDIMQTGLWRYSRHPNYFGEITTWWGAFLVALSVGGWWGMFGSLLITVLIVKVSGIPPLEKHYAGNKDYEAYRLRTSILVPLPPKAKS